jgi:hypothetical protein
MSNFIKALSVGIDLFRAEGRTDIHDEANSFFFFRNFAKAPNTNFLFHDSKSVDGNSLRSSEHLETNPYLL